MKNKINLFSLSEFIKLLSKILDAKIPQSREVSTGKTVNSKFERFNKNDRDQGTENELIKQLLGILTKESDFLQFISEDEKLSLSGYKKILNFQINFTETLIATIQSSFLYHDEDVYTLRSNLLQYVVTPIFVSLNNYDKNIPSFVPIVHFNEIVAELLFNYGKTNDSFTTIIRQYLNNKASSIIKKKIPHHNFEIFSKIKDIKEDSIQNSRTVYQNSIVFLEQLNYFTPNTQNRSAIFDFMGSYSCCMILLRLRKYLTTEYNDQFFHYFIFYVMTYSALLQGNNQCRERILAIKEQDLDRFIEYYENVMERNDLDNQINILRLVNQLIKEYLDIYEKKNLTMKAFIAITKKILNKIDNFKPNIPQDLANLVTQGIDYKPIINKNKLISLLDEVDTLDEDSYVYKKALVSFISSIIEMKSGNIDNAFKYIEQVVLHERKKWHLGKIASDSFIIYISLKLIKSNNIKHPELSSLLACYAESKEPEITITLPIGHIENKDIGDDYILDTYIETIISKFMKLSTILQLDSEIFNININKLPKNIGYSLPYSRIITYLD